MSHSFGERLLPPSQDPPEPSLPSASGALSERQAKEAPAIQGKNVTAMGNAADVIADVENYHTDASYSALPLLSSDKMDTWTLTQLKDHLEEVVVQKRAASGRARQNLEIQRLSLIERVTRLERAEEKKRDTARRVVIGRDVAPPPPDPIEKPWRKKRFRSNTRRSGPVELPMKVKKKGDEEEEESPEEELHSKRWKLKRKPIVEDAAEEIEREVEDRAEGVPEEEATDEVAKETEEEAEIAQEVDTEALDEDKI